MRKMNRYKITSEKRKEGNVVESIPGFITGRKAAEILYHAYIKQAKEVNWDTDDTIDDIIVTFDLVDEQGTIIKKITDRYFCDPYYYNM